LWSEVLLWGQGLRSFLAALDCADSLFKQNEAFFHVGQCAEPNLDRTSPAVESAEDFGLHVAHLLDQIFAEPIHISMQVGAEPVHISIQLRTELIHISIQLRTELVHISVQLRTELVHFSVDFASKVVEILLGCGAVVVVWHRAALK
jgi:hypothetical protein